MAASLKAKGNEFFKKQNWDKAIEMYSEAINLNENGIEYHTYYSNRSACYAGKNDYNNALNDAIKCIELKPDFIKGYSRKGLALFRLKKYQESKKCYEDGLKINSNDASLKAGLDQCNKMIEKQKQNENNPFAKMFEPSKVYWTIQNNPELREYANDASFMKSVNFLIKNPQMAMQMNMLNDPKMSKLLSALLGLPTKPSNDDDNNENENNNDNNNENNDDIERVFVGQKDTIIERDNYVESMTPKKTVESLNKYIIGQDKAKKAVAVSLRNRWRRQQLDDLLRKEVSPMNILMMGPTGSGKTEIARRLAQMVDAPFVKTEATKYTEVGIVGQSAEECVKDLVDKSVKMEREKRIAKLKEEVDEKVERHILSRIPGSSANPDETKRKLRDGELDNHKIEVASFRIEPQTPYPYISTSKGINILNMSPKQPRNISDNDKKRDRVPVSEAREIIKEYELSKSLDDNDIRRTGVRRAEESGIIFLDEIDKLVDSGTRGDYKGVKGEGVQKELLGLIEGTTVQTESGIVNTDHMLFICAGAFHSANPSDLLPELQGRVPIRVNLEPLTEDDFYKILTDTESNLLIQQQSLFGAEGVDIEFTEDGIREIAKISKELNESLDNIGARRLRAVISKIVEELSYNAPDMKGQKVIIDRDYVRTQLADIIKDEDLSKYIL